MTEMSEEDGSIRITFSEGSSLHTLAFFVYLDSCCFFLKVVDDVHTTVLVCPFPATLEVDFNTEAGSGDLTLSVAPLLLTGWYLGIGNLRFF